LALSRLGITPLEASIPTPIDLGSRSRRLGLAGWQAGS
jgi:hypothetical protein